MHHRFLRIVRPTVAAVACLALATASAVEENTEVKSVRIARTYGSQAMGPSRLVVWLGVEEPYLLDLPPGCTDLTRDPASALTSHRRQLQAGTDAVLTATARCPIVAVRRADRRELEATGIRRAGAQPLRVVPANPTPKAR
jgi:hypothetical protein